MTGIAGAGDLLEQRELGILRLREDRRDLQPRRRMQHRVEPGRHVHRQAPISRTKTRCHSMLPMMPTTTPTAPSSNGVR